MFLDQIEPVDTDPAAAVRAGRVLGNLVRLIAVMRRPALTRDVPSVHASPIERPPTICDLVRMLVKLVGGTMNGATVRLPPHGNTLIGPARSEGGAWVTDTYTSRRYVSPYPVPGWDYEISERIEYGLAGTQLWWSARLWATDDGHTRIEKVTQRILSPALAHLAWARASHDSAMCDHATAEVDQAIADLLELTQPETEATAG